MEQDKIVLTKNLSLLFVISFLYMFVGVHYGLSNHDEGAFAYGGARVFTGDVPYRDFWTFYPPGEFYLLACLFKIFGKSLMLIRLLSITLQSLIVVCVYFIAYRLTCKSKIAFIPAILSILYIPGPFAYGYYSHPIIPALLLSIFSCIVLVAGGKNILAGILVGGTVLFRHDIAFYVFFSQTIALFLFYKNISRFLKYFSGVLAIIIPVFLFFIVNVGFNELIYDLIVFPAKVYPKVRALSYQSITPVSDTLSGIIGNNAFAYSVISFLQYIPFYFPIIVYIFAIIQIVKDFKTKQHFSEEEIFFVLLTITGILFFNQARIRSDAQHLIPTIIPAIILSFIMIHNFLQKHNSKILNKATVFLVLPVIFLSFGFDSIKSKASYFARKTFKNNELMPLEFGVSKNIVVLKKIGTPILEAVNFIKNNTSANEKIFVCNTRHDKVFVTDMMFYFLSERNSATKYFDLHPGLATTLEIQRKIIDELEQFNVRYIIMWDKDSNIIEPNESSKSSNVVELDKFIATNYKRVKEYPPYIILSLTKNKK